MENEIWKWHVFNYWLSAWFYHETEKNLHPMNKDGAYNYIRSKFVMLKETRNLIKKHGLKIKYGFLSEGETSTVRRVVGNFLRQRRLTLRDLQKHLIEETDFPLHDLLYECTQACEFRTYKSIHTHIAYYYNPFIHASWNVEEEVQLLDLVNQKGFKWKEISYHLSKYKDLCRIRYLSLKGESAGNISRKRIEQLLTTGLPSTDEEWRVLCEELKLCRSYISRKIDKYLNGKELCGPESKMLEIHLSLLILKNNHYCKFDISIDSIIEFLNSEPSSLNLVDRIDGASTPFVSVRGKKREGSADGEPGSMKTECGGSGEDHPEDGLDVVLKRVQSARTVSESQTKFLNRFLDFFCLSKDFDLSIRISRDDIFWLNITREMVLERHSVYTKYNQLKQQYGWRTFKDIYDTVVKISYDHVILMIKQNLVRKSLDTLKTGAKRDDGLGCTPREQIQSAVIRDDGNTTHDK